MKRYSFLNSFIKFLDMRHFFIMLKHNKNQVNLTISKFAYCEVNLIFWKLIIYLIANKEYSNVQMQFLRIKKEKPCQLSKMTVSKGQTALPMLFYLFNYIS